MANKGYILMLEKDEHDVELSSAYFEAMRIPAQFVKQSNQVMLFLNKAIAEGSELPALILLSMNSLPDNGLDVLRQVKAEKQFRYIPVIILGENSQPDLIKSCYAEGASTYINKPFTNALTDSTIKTFLLYWFEVAALVSPSRLQYS